MISKPETKGRIRAAAKIIADISTGIYRSPANALKELVSNAFDAGATEVRIDTDHPGFTTVTCYDNGNGISKEEIKDAFELIGGSDKRTRGERTVYNRPIIGKIGIGILAMCQLTQQFVIISSKKGSSNRIEVEIDIEPFQSQDANRINLGEGDIGEYQIFEFPEERERHYTIITTPAGSRNLKLNLREGEDLKDSFASHKYLEAATFEEFVKGVGILKSITLGQYQTFLWELASLCPVEYFEDGPVKGWDGWDHIKQQLRSYNFKVYADGFELRKPILLPLHPGLTSRGSDYEIYPLEKKVVDTKSKKVLFHAEGYIYHQRLQLVPTDLQGILVRIRNVGIGAYDKSLLDYPVNIGPMVRGMTGEVYIHDGLEDALNIDRNSFNQIHEDFLTLQKTLYTHIGMPDEPGFAKDIRRRSARVQEERRVDDYTEYISLLATRARRQIDEPDLKLKFDDDLDVPLRFDIAQKEVRVNISHPSVPEAKVKALEFFHILFAFELMVGTVTDISIDDLTAWIRKLGGHGRTR